MGMERDRKEGMSRRNDREEEERKLLDFASPLQKLLRVSMMMNVVMITH